MGKRAVTVEGYWTFGGGITVIDDDDGVLCRILPEDVWLVPQIVAAILATYKNPDEDQPATPPRGEGATTQD